MRFLLRCVPGQGLNQPRPPSHPAILCSPLTELPPLTPQRRDGSWYGSWACCFTYGTWFGVEGLVAAGEPLSRGMATDRPDTPPVSSIGIPVSPSSESDYFFLASGHQKGAIFSFKLFFIFTIGCANLKMVPRKGRLPHAYDDHRGNRPRQVFRWYFRVPQSCLCLLSNIPREQPSSSSPPTPSPWSKPPPCFPPLNHTFPAADSPSIQRAVAFLLRHQNANGGWGEDFRSCFDKEYPKEGMELYGTGARVCGALKCFCVHGSPSRFSL